MPDKVIGGGLLQNAQAVGVDADGETLVMNGCRYASFACWTDATGALLLEHQQGVETAMAMLRARWDQAALTVRYEGSNDGTRWVTLQSVAVAGGALVSVLAHVPSGRN